jgi:hypothetical protein
MSHSDVCIEDENNETRNNYNFHYGEIVTLISMKNLLLWSTTVSAMYIDSFCVQVLLFVM